METQRRGRARWRLPTVVVALVALAMVGTSVGVHAYAVATNDAPPPKVHVTLDVYEKTVKVLGVPFQAWTYNGTIPGHIIRITQGTELTIELRNGHTEIHSIHTHIQGYPIQFDGASHTAPFSIVPQQADDPLAVTGATGSVEETLGEYPTLGVNPIGEYSVNHNHDVAFPGQTVNYTFVAGEVGTFVYHCHVFSAMEHIERGMMGLIVVYPKGWTWNELPEKQPGVGNTAAWVTKPDGTVMYEDTVIMSELDPSTLTDKVPFPLTPAGKIHLANFRAWNDPYYIGPVEPGTHMRVLVVNLGDEMHAWHLHGHNFNVIDKFDPDQKVLFRTDVLTTAPGQSYVTEFTALQPGFWFAHDHIVPEAYAGMVPWLRVGV